MVKTCGIVAGDEESYELFGPLFSAIVLARHSPVNQPIIPDLTLPDGEMDKTGKYILSLRRRFYILVNFKVQGVQHSG